MTITNASLGMQCTGPITIAGILTLHGRYTPSPFLRGNGPPLLAMTTNMRTRAHGELRQIIYNQASNPKSDKRGKIGTGFKPGKVIIGVVVGLCVISVMSRRYEAQIMSLMPNFAYMSQVFENFMGTKQDRSIAGSQKKLEKLLRMAIDRSKIPPNAELKKLIDASDKDYLSGLKEVDKFIEQGHYNEAENKCETLEATSHMDSSVVLRKFIALIGQAKIQLERYNNETKSSPRLEAQHKQMNHLIYELTRVVMDEFKVKNGKDLKNTNIESNIEAFLKGQVGEGAILQFFDKMKKARVILKEYKEIEEDFSGQGRERG